MDPEDPVFIFADLETEGLRGELLLQIAAVSDTDSFSIYINPHRNLPISCTKITGLSYLKGLLYKDGKQLQSDNSVGHALKSFNKWLSQQGQRVHLVFHNAFGFDARVLTKQLLKFNISLPSNIQFIHDSLPAFRKHIKADKQNQIPSDGLKLTKLGLSLGLDHTDPHNAVSDSILLKQICEAYSKQQGISLIQLLDGYKKPPSFFVTKIQTPKKTETKRK